MPGEGRHAGGVLRGDAVSTLVSGRLRVYLWIGAVAVVAGLLLRRPEPLIVGAPFILAAALCAGYLLATRGSSYQPSLAEQVGAVPGGR